MLGKQPSCGNCTSEDLEMIPLGKRGQLWTYTIIYHRPPGQYREPDPFVPFAEGLVELPEGVRVLSVLDCPIDQVKIGMELEFTAYELYIDEKGNSVVAFKFKAV